MIVRKEENRQRCALSRPLFSLSYSPQNTTADQHLLVQVPQRSRNLLNDSQTLSHEASTDRLRSLYVGTSLNPEINNTVMAGQVYLQVFESITIKTSRLTRSLSLSPMTDLCLITSFVLAELRSVARCGRHLQPIDPKS